MEVFHFFLNVFQHQQQVATAVERAKQVTMTELNAIIGVKYQKIIIIIFKQKSNNSNVRLKYLFFAPLYLCSSRVFDSLVLSFFLSISSFFFFLLFTHSGVLTHIHNAQQQQQAGLQQLLVSKTKQNKSSLSLFYFFSYVTKLHFVT